MASVFETTAGLSIGYTTGSAVTQATNKATGVTINSAAGQITMNGAALADAAEVTFVVTNDKVAATDVPYVVHANTGTAGADVIQVTAVAAGSFKVTVGNVSGGALSEAIVLNYAVFKSAAS